MLCDKCKEPIMILPGEVMTRVCGIVRTFTVHHCPECKDIILVEQENTDATNS